ncbi:hypothetical protein PG991_010374 [Apiospora marii]|uniref:Uncharacterized protein n=1 Tax=Apiospora marii TaxID=335849 RepID=A0ABR1RI85_9PEZI
MEPESANKEIEGWISRGLMVPARIMERLDAEAADGRALGEEEQAELQKTFSAIEGQALSPAALLNLLQTRVGFSTGSPLSEEAANVLFRCLWYLSTIPFPPNPSKDQSPPPSLTIAQTTRGLAWLLPGRCRVMIGQGNLSRSRTAADHRRLLRRGPRRPSCPQRHRGPRPHQDWPVVNRDGDGDELFHDLLEVLYATQPRGPVWLAPVDRDGFRWAAKGIVAQLPSAASSSSPNNGSGITNRLPLLDSLAVPRGRLEAVVMLALAAGCLLEEGEEDTEGDGKVEGRQTRPVVQLKLSEVDEAALDRVVAPFCGHDKATELVSWPMFDDALRDNPDLFNSLYEVMSRALFNQRWETTV